MTCSYIEGKSGQRIVLSIGENHPTLPRLKNYLFYKFGLRRNMSECLSSPQLWHCWISRRRNENTWWGFPVVVLTLPSILYLVQFLSSSFPIQCSSSFSFYLLLYSQYFINFSSRLSAASQIGCSICKMGDSIFSLVEIMVIYYGASIIILKA